MFLNIIIILFLFFRQILDLGLLEYSSNLILGPTVLMTFILLNNKNKYNITKISILLIYLIIALILSMLLGYNDYKMILSEILSLFLFIVIIPSIKTNNTEIEKFYKLICYLFIVLVLMKLLIEYKLIDTKEYIFVNKNSWAQTLLFPLFISFYLYHKEKKKRYLIIIISSLILIVLSFARTAIVAAFAFLSIYYLILTKRKKIKLIYIISILLLISLILIFRDIIFIYIIKYYIRSDQNIITNRDLLWNVAFNTFKSAPIFGVGRGVTQELIIMSGIGLRNKEFHSLFLEILAYGGVISALFYGFIFTNAFINALKLIKLNNKLGSVVLCSQISIFIYMLAETFYPFGLSLNNYISGLFLFSIPSMYIKGKIENDC